MPFAKPPGSAWTIALYALVAAPIWLSLAVLARVVYTEMNIIRTVALRSEMDQLRWQAGRRAGRLENLIQLHAGSKDWPALRNEAWLQKQWTDRNELAAHQLYYAVVDTSGTIVLHSDPQVIGQSFDRGAEARPVVEAGSDVVRLERSRLAANGSALDVRVPMMLGSQKIGDFRQGLDALWFDRSVALQQRELLVSRLWMLGVVLLVDAAALWGIWRLIRLHRRLVQRAATALEERSRRLMQLGLGLAHEIRNPLHAIRINLHTLRRSFGSRVPSSESQVADTIRESDQEIDQLDALLRDLVQYTVPSVGQREALDVGREIQATLNLLSGEMRRKQIDVQVQFADPPLMVTMEPARLRQLAVNLLTFAQKNAGEKGQIIVAVERQAQHGVLSVADSGPSLTDVQQARIFEPFESAVETGSGLGLSLVQRFVEDAGGIVRCERRPPSGNRFRVLLPLSSNSSREGGTL